MVLESELGMKNYIADIHLNSNTMSLDSSYSPEYLRKSENEECLSAVESSD